MKIKKYFTTINIIEGLIIALFLSAFIYIEHFNLIDGYFLLIINSLNAIIGLYLLIKAKTPVWFFAGFFIGVFWLWWLGVSFYYYNLTYLIPFVILSIGLIYGLIFLLLAYISKLISIKIENYFLGIFWEKSRIILNAFMLILLNFFEPFGFNWLKLELIFVDSIFCIKIYCFIAIIFIIAITILTKRWYLILFLIFLLDFKTPKVLKPNTLKYIELVSTNINVKEKWNPKNQIKYTKLALKKIDKAIAKGKKLVILPESILPYFLNLETPYLNELKKLSFKIKIVIGSLYFKSQGNYRNSAYIIDNGKYKIANKVVLVPFGEVNPLPSFMGKIVNKIFFDGAVDYKADNNFTYINVLNKRFKIAICYEGTHPKTFEDKPKFLIVISNNGWFKPSIEPTLQKILMKYFVRLYKSTIYHSINGSPSYIIIPHPEVKDE